MKWFSDEVSRRKAGDERESRERVEKENSGFVLGRNKKGFTKPQKRREKLNL